MIKVCFYAYHAHHLFKRSERSYGGAEINFFYLSRELAKKVEYQVSMLVGDDGQPALEIIDGVRLKKIKRYHERNKNLTHRILKRFYIIKEFATNDADIFVISTAMAGNIMFYCLLFAKWMRGKKIVYRIASDRDIDGYYMNNKTAVSRQFRFSLKYIDKIIAQNKRQQALLLKKENLQSIVIKNGFPVVKKKIKFKKKYNLWVGRSVKIKKPEIFLEIAAQLPEQYFVMIIPGKGVTKDLVLKKSQLLSNVQIIDQVNFFEIEQYFSEAKCLVNTSDFEGFPNTFIQSFINYTPICSINVNPDNIIEEYLLGKFCNGNIQEAVIFLDKLGEEESKTLGENGFRYVMKHHHLTDKVQRYEKLFSQLIHKK